MAKTYNKLTKDAMSKLLPGAGIRESGIVFERQTNGDGIFTAELMVSGERIHRVIGRESDGTTRTQASDYIARLQEDAKNDRLALPKGRKLALSFRDVAIKYLEKLPQEGGRDLKMKRCRLELHLIPFFGDMPLSKLSTFDLDRYKHLRRNENSQRGGDRVSRKPRLEIKNPAKSSDGSINRELAVVSHIFTMAIEWGWISHRPAKIKRLKEGDGRIMCLTSGADEAVARMREAVQQSLPVPVHFGRYRDVNAHVRNSVNPKTGHRY